ncbi:1-aminocyclopropane-1-carboxylate deaminase/D-cysteine desulfhydrase [Paraglaciecola sp. L3A3]|uniref:1-aminocyclopropane-1-carboxylate deaminase/D-cysteine desulfhydrase n=1 Tax=Paraglaciecola sp. L3A3 TaxID=2686358 RepID=UPI00131E0875|nr:pyridoxal-phosphate dependent enzyme [Paraglaciecola sp. L3A3]
MTTTDLTPLLKIILPSPEQSILLQGTKITIKRDDSIHAIISGNKWRKIKFQLIDALEQKCPHIISFGGGFSNHLHALAYCCRQLNIKFTAIVRGDYSQNLSPMLQDLVSWQSDIRYVNKITYQARNSSYLHQLQIEFPQAVIIPEGGSSQYALEGVGEIVNELNQEYDFIIAPVASGGTLAGLINALGNKQLANKTKVLGIGVLKGQNYLEDLVTDLLPPDCHNKNWQINHDYHFGGYAKKTEELTQYCTDFNQQQQLDIEPIYSGKLFFAIQDLLHQKYFPKNSRILALHTGGLQGVRK